MCEINVFQKWQPGNNVNANNDNDYINITAAKASHFCHPDLEFINWTVLKVTLSHHNLVVFGWILLHFIASPKYRIMASYRKQGKFYSLGSPR